jgi:adenosylhomocysteinase
MVKNAKNLTPAVYTIPQDIDREIARLKLEALGVTIDVLTAEQAEYLSQWEEGT